MNAEYSLPLSESVCLVLGYCKKDEQLLSHFFFETETGCGCHSVLIQCC